MQTRDVMKAHPSVVLADDSIQKAARIMRDRNIGMLPVVGNLRYRSLMGVLTDRDIVVRCAAAGHGADCKVRDHMTRGAIVSVEPDAGVREVEVKMEGFHLRRLPVVDAAGGVVGVVALADILRELSSGQPSVRFGAHMPEYEGSHPILAVGL